MQINRVYIVLIYILYSLSIYIMIYVFRLATVEVLGYTSLHTTYI